MTDFVLGSLTARPAAQLPHLLAEPTRALISQLGWGERLGVVEIDPAVSDTAAFLSTHSLTEDLAANCVVVAGSRNGEERVAACVILANTRADVNGAVRRLLDVRKASFLPLDDAVTRTGMEYGGITPIGLPEQWRVFIDSRVVGVPLVTLGAGVREAKILIPGELLAHLPGATVIDDLARPVA